MSQMLCHNIEFQSGCLDYDLSPAFNSVMAEGTLSSGESHLLPPWPGCAGHVKRSLPLEQPPVRCFSCCTLGRHFLVKERPLGRKFFVKERPLGRNFFVKERPLGRSKRGLKIPSMKCGKLALSPFPRIVMETNWRKHLTES